MSKGDAGPNFQTYKETLLWWQKEVSEELKSSSPIVSKGLATCLLDCTKERVAKEFLEGTYRERKCT